MIAGCVMLEDHVVSFKRNEDGSVTYTVSDSHTSKSEVRTVDGPNFFKALSIAVHNDGTPIYWDDYPGAESVMGEIRWIP